MRPAPGFPMALVAVLAVALLARPVRSDEDAPPPIPYGTQETIRLNAIVDAAPFMAGSEDRVVTLKQERLRTCAQILAHRFEAFTIGREQSFVGLTESVAAMKSAWLALCASEEQKMPMLEFALQLAEQREKSSQAMFDQGRLSAIENLAARGERLSAEIEMIECQRAMNARK